MTEEMLQQVVHDLTEAVKRLSEVVQQLTLNIALQEQSIQTMRATMEADGGIGQRINQLRSDFSYLRKDFDEFRHSIQDVGTKWGGRAFDIFKMILPWLAAAGLAYIMSKK